MMTEWSRVPTGNALIAAWAITFAGVTIFSFQHKSKPLPKQKRDKTPEFKTLIISLLSKRAVAIRISLFSLVICLRLWVSIKISKQIGKMGSLLAQRKWRQLAESQITYSIWTVPGAFLNALVEYSASALALSVREDLVSRVHQSYTRNLVELRNTMPDSEQRSTGDIEKLSRDIALLYQSIFRPIAETSILSIALARLMGVKQLLVCYGYFAFAGSWSRYVTPSLTNISGTLQENEGAFRASHSRVKEYAEEIRFNRGEVTEALLLDRSFKTLCANHEKFNFQKLLSSWLDGYAVRYMGILAALTAMAPALRQNNNAIDDPTEFFLTCLHLLVNLMAAFKDIILGARTLSDVKGLSNRVEVLLRSTPMKDRLVTTNGEHSIQLHAVTICPPGSEQPIISNLTLEVREGFSVFLHGANGVGKTSIFRVLSGVWTPSHGRVHVPEDCMFLTSRPYILPSCTLRQQLMYPRIDAMVDDQVLLDALMRVEMSSDKSLLDAPCRSDGLSSGEMQRMACARLLVRRPKFACLDECTSACTQSFEKAFFEHIINVLGITVLTVSHRKIACDLHPIQMDLNRILN